MAILDWMDTCTFGINSRAAQVATGVFSGASAMPRRLPRHLLLILLLLISPPSVKGKRRQAQKQKMATKKQCGEVECADVHSDGRDNCILKCTSPACYEEIYAADELEPGEIDNKRSRDFNGCLQRVMREEQQKRRDEARAKVTAAVESNAESEAGGEDEDSPTPIAEPLAVEL